MASKPSQYNLPAILALLLAATLWGLIWYPLRELENAGISGLWASLFMYSAAMLVAIPYFISQRSHLLSQPALFILIAIFSGWTNIAFILAVIEGNVVRVVLLFYLSPLWAVLFARLFLGEKFTPRALLMLGLAMMGAVLMLWKPEQAGNWLFTPADWLALSASVAFAATNVTVRYAHAMPLGLKSSATWLGVCILAALWIILGDSPLPEVEGDLLIGIFVVGGIAMIVMTLTVQYGVSHMPVQRSAVILLFELIVAAVAAQILTSEQVTALEWFGGGLIIAASLLAAYKQDVEKNV